MRDAPGVGLAAPQLGEPLAACVIEVGDQLYELVNPRIVRTTGDDRDLEGCLSHPGLLRLRDPPRARLGRRPEPPRQEDQGRRIRASSAGRSSTSSTTSTGKLFIDYLDSMDELIPVGADGDDDDGDADGEWHDAGRTRRRRRSA